MRNRRKRTETTKILLVISWAAAITLTALTVLFSLLELPTDGLQVVTPLAWAEVTALNGFYIWKAKNENRAKYAQEFVEKMADKYGAESAALIAEVILKE